MIYYCKNTLKMLTYSIFLMEAAADPRKDWWQGEPSGGSRVAKP
jgi:hypothetical protein